MIGTRYSVTRPIRLIPPRMTAAVTTTSTRPVAQVGTSNVARITSATELACTMFPMPKAAVAVSSAKSVPSQGRPRPWLSTYIAPPRIVPDASAWR